jgi:coenzyme F420-0:L-glutamate ligase/coenzyme F420-1:gamma-L-glutamate ligase
MTPVIPALQLFAIPGLPAVQPGDNLVTLLVDGLQRTNETLRDGDILIIAQKIISKIEGRHVALADVVPSARAQELAAASGKDPRLVELILSEAREVLRVRPGLIVVEHRLGFVAANAGVDQSNVGAGANGEVALLLPRDPDATCRRLREAIRAQLDRTIAVVISDSFGRAWRMGTIGTAIGLAGFAPVDFHAGRHDLFGRPLRATAPALADGIAAAATLLQGEADEGRPLVVLRGLAWTEAPGTAADLLRPREQDLFR